MPAHSWFPLRRSGTDNPKIWRNKNLYFQSGWSKSNPAPSQHPEENPILSRSKRDLCGCGCGAAHVSTEKRLHLARFPHLATECPRVDPQPMGNVRNHSRTHDLNKDRNLNWDLQRVYHFLNGVWKVQQKLHEMCLQFKVHSLFKTFKNWVYNVVQDMRAWGSCKIVRGMVQSS